MTKQSLVGKRQPFLAQSQNTTAQVEEYTDIVVYTGVCLAFI